MKCPACTNILMRVKVQDYYVETCSECGGTWFEQDNFGDFVRTLSISDNIPNSMPDMFKHRDVLAPQKLAEETRTCPRCYKDMRKFNYSYDSNVILDRCPDCGGTWADNDEVRQAASHLKSDPRTIDAARSILEVQKLAKPEIDPDDVYPGRYLGQLRIILPLSDDTPSERFPAMTIAIIAICTLVFLAHIALAKTGHLDKFESAPLGEFTTEALKWMFLSSGPLFFAVNMVFLWLFGDNVEDRFSRLGYLIFYICCTVVSAIAYILFRGDVATATIGVSGAVSGIMGAYLVFYPRANITVYYFYRTIEVPAALFLGLWFLFQLLSPMIFKDAPLLNAGWPAHVSGFVFGAIIAYARKKPTTE